MKLEVRVDEADVGAVREGQRATFTVDAYPGRTFPAAVTRSTSAPMPPVSTAASASGTGSVVAYTAELACRTPSCSFVPA